MSYHVARLPRPYDYRALIEAYTYTQRRDFVHPNFGAYYAGLLGALERLFGLRLAGESVPGRRRALWMLFQITVDSRLQITTPWDGFLETGALDNQLEDCGELGAAVYRASAAIADAAKASEAAHRELLSTLFVAMFGECDRVVTSDELRQAGFDDSREPDVREYDDHFSMLIRPPGTW